MKLFKLFFLILIPYFLNSQSSIKSDFSNQVKTHLIQNKNKIDEKSKIDKPKIYIKVASFETITRVLESEIPDEYEILYELFEENNSVYKITQLISSESGDWSINLKYYFDSDGNVFIIEKKTSQFNSNCGEVIFETITKLIDINNDKTLKIINLEDGKGKQIKRKNCDLYDYKFKIYKNIEDYLENNKININEQAFYKQRVRIVEKKIKGTTDIQKNAVIEEPKKSEAFTMVEQMPEFEGGEDSLKQYIARNTKYPPNVIENKVTGIVFVSFIVNEDGSISEAQVTKGINGGCNEEALKVINNMPKWKPGKQSGHKVRVYYEVPVVFSVQ
jgi:TonB family protein